MTGVGWGERIVIREVRVARKLLVDVGWKVPIGVLVAGIKVLVLIPAVPRKLLLVAGRLAVVAEDVVVLDIP